MYCPARLRVTVLAACAVLLAGCLSPLAAQETGTIRGRVTDAATQRPLPSVQISIPGAGRGALTNAAGEFLLLNIPAGTHTVRAQLIGFGTEESPVSVTAGQTAVANFALGQQALALDEVVVTGTAGQARRREVGNTIAQIDASKVNEPVRNVDDLLQGRAAGITVTQASGMAGSGSQVRLRGNTSVSMSNQPLLYVDGVRVRSDGYPKNVPPTGFQGRGANDASSPLNDINPNDIQRIEVIKGAAATTLYGTEAAAGVIQIFTKRGTAGAPVWTAQIDQGFARLLPFAPDVPSEVTDSTPGQSKYLFIDPWLRDAWQQKYSLSVSGGSETVTYFVSGAFNDNQGVLPNDAERKMVLRGNFGFSPIRNLQLDWNTSYTNDDITNTPAGNNAHGLTLNAFRRERNYFSSGVKRNIDQVLDYEINTGIDHLILGGTATYTAFENLTNRVTAGYDRAALELRQLRPYGFFAAPGGVLANRQWTNETITLDYVGTYNWQVSERFRSSFSWGGQSIATDLVEVIGQSENFAGPGEPTLSGGAVQITREDRQRVINAGVFVQNLFGISDRYFLTAGMRVDGNSAFGENLGLQVYPKVSLSYVISDEAFWPERFGQVKLRAAYGHAGRAPGAFDAVRTWDPEPWGPNPGFDPRRVGNPDLGPERTQETEIGFDAGFFGGRLTADFTYYNQHTVDALFPVRQIPSEGFIGTDFSTQLQNVGEIANRGVELAINAGLLQSPSFSWDVGLNVATNRSEVLDLGGAPPFSLDNLGWVEEGQPAPAIRGILIRNPDQVAEPDTVHNHYFGPNQPTHTINLSTILGLPRGLQLSARGEYQGGHYMYDNASFNALQRSVRWPTCYDARQAIDAGNVESLTAEQRLRCVARGIQDEFFVYPADFFKIRDLTLRIPASALVPGASTATLSLAAQNFWTWKNEDFPIFDPEMAGQDGVNTTVRHISEHIPSAARFTASIRVVF